MELYIEKVEKYINSYPRNKLVITQDADLTEWLDLGKILSQKMSENDRHRIYIKINAILEDFINDFQIQHKLLGAYLPIKNFGILLEPELKINFLKFLENYSQNLIIILYWEGLIEDKTLYFLDKQEKYKIDLKNTSHIII